MKVGSQISDPRVAPQAPPGGVFDELTTLLAFARETLSRFFELASLEVRRAGLGLLGMLSDEVKAAA